MFGGILTKFLLGALVVSLLGGGVLYVKGKWQAARYEKEIRELQNVAITLRAELAKAQAEDKDKQVVIKYRERKTNESAEIDKVVGAGDDANMDRVFVDLGMLPKDALRPAASGGESRPGH